MRKGVVDRRSGRPFSRLPPSMGFTVGVRLMESLERDASVQRSIYQAGHTHLSLGKSEWSECDTERDELFRQLPRESDRRMPTRVRARSRRLLGNRAIRMRQ